MTSERAQSNVIEVSAAFDDWWDIVGQAPPVSDDENTVASQRDAFAAGAEWMRGECERITTAQAQEDMANYAEDNNFGAEAVAEQIKALGRDGAHT